MKRAYARAIPAPWRRIARIFVALGDPHRQRILLMFERGERLNVGQIVAASTLSRTAVSQKPACWSARKSARKYISGLTRTPCAWRSTRCVTTWRRITDTTAKS